MKTIIVIISLLLSTSMLAEAQLNKGGLLIGGGSSFDLSFGGIKQKSDEVDPEGSNTTEFKLDIPLGYFVMDKLAVGLMPAFSVHYTKSPDDEKRTTTTFSLSPFVRYYFPDLLPVDKTSLFVQGRIGGGSRTTKNTHGSVSVINKTNIFLHGIDAGLAYFIHDKVSLNGKIGYATEVSREPDEEDNERTVDWDIGFSGGISIYF